MSKPNRLFKRIIFGVLACSLFISCNSNISSSDSLSSTNSTSENSSVSTTSSTSSPSEAVRFEGVEDVKVLQGEFFSPLKDVNAFDELGNDITNQVQIKGNVDYGTPGVYEVEYVCNSTAKKRKVEIIKNDDLNKNDDPLIYQSDELYVISLGNKVDGNYKDSAYASYLTDGNLSTRYESIWEEKTSFVIIDLGAILAFEKIELYFEAASAKKYNISVSDDGKSFVNISTITGQYGARTDEVEISSRGRYIRFDFLEKSMEAYGYSLYEISIYGYQGTAIPKNLYPDLFTSKAIEDEQYLELEFASSRTITRSTLVFYDLAPLSYSVEVFDTSWQQIYIGSFSSVNFDKAYECSKIRFKFHERRFNSFCYRVSQIELYNNDERISLNNVTITASSYKSTYVPNNAKENYGTFWASDYKDESAQYIMIDLNGIKQIGLIDLLFENNYGKIYDIDLSNDGINYQTAYRQLKGATRVQSILLAREAAFIRIHDYSSSSSLRHRLENCTVHSKTEYEEPYDIEVADLPTLTVKDVGEGSYVENDVSFPTARYVAYDDSSREGAVPSNGIWQSLLINNYGHAMYFYPLRAKYTSQGLGVSYPGEGYFETTYRRSQVVTDTIDLYLKPTSINKEVTTKIIDDSDTSVGVSFSDNEAMKMVNYFAQGNPYVSSFFAFKEAEISFNQESIVYAKDGTVLNIDESVTDDYITISISSLASYDSSHQPIYEDRTYLIYSQGATFKRGEEGLDISLLNNYLSLVCIPEDGSLEDFVEAASYGVLEGRIDYQVTDDIVSTTYNYLGVNYGKEETSQGLVCVLPHQRKKLVSKDLKSYYYKSVRGNIFVVTSNSFKTEDTFYGISAVYDEPDDETYSRSTMKQYLEKLDKDTSGNILSADAYWQGKSLHPLANGALIANQMGLFSLRDTFVSRLKTILKEWYTYQGENDEFYFYYDDMWGTLYYKVSEFGANFNLADHHFTYGYYVFASMVAFQFDSQFKSDYQDMVNLLIKDYMNYEDDEEIFTKFRCYDYYAGHSWAGGYADTDGGNNQESASESINSYQAAYLYAELMGDKDLKDAATYCYTTELASIKQYWFDYDGDSYSESYPYQGVGQIYGGSNFYGTFFNGDPTYIYGIHLLPSGEYLTSYALGEEEKEKLKNLYEAYVREEEAWTGHAAEDGYQHIYWVILAMFDPDAALNRLDTRLSEIQNSNELFNVYYLIHSLKSMGTRSKDVTSTGLPCSVYTKDGVTKALVNNFTDYEKEVVFYENGKVISKSYIAPHQNALIDPYKSNKVTAPLQSNNIFYLENADSVETFDSYNKYYFTFIFDAKNYIFSFEVINHSTEDKIIFIQDEQGRVLDELSVPKDEYLDIKSNILAFEGRRKLSFIIPHDIQVRSMVFNVNK